MSPMELERKLKKAGFSLKKKGTKHMIYEKNGVESVVSYGTKVSHHAARATLVAIRRAG